MRKQGIDRSIDTQIIPTPKELAECFCEMDMNEQAEFFNQIRVATEKWEHPFCFQLQAITDSRKLGTGGRAIMRQIGEYSEEHK